MSNIAGNMSRSRSKGPSVGEGNLSRTLSDQSAVVGFITSWADLGTSGASGRRKIYHDGSNNRMVLVWNNTASRWEALSTLGSWITLDDFNDGALQTSLWDLTDANGRADFSNNRFEFTVVSGENIGANIAPKIGLYVPTFIRFEFNFGGVADSTSAGTMTMFMRQFDFDGDGDSDPRNVIKGVISDDIDSPTIEHVYQDADGGFTTVDVVTDSDRNVTYTFTNLLSTQSSLTQGKVEALDSGGAVQGQSTHDFTADWSGNVGDFRFIFNNTGANTSGVMWIDNIEIQSGTRTFRDWKYLGTGSQNGERAEYLDGTGNGAILEWDASRSEWVLASTRGEWVTIDDFDGTSIDTDLWTVDDPDGRTSVSGGELQSTVNAVDTSIPTLACVFRCEMGSAAKVYGSLNGLGQPASGTNEIRLQLIDFDEDDDANPYAELKYRYDFGQNPRMNSVAIEESGSSNFGDAATSLNAADDYSWSVEVTDDGSNATANYEAFDSGDVSLGTDSHIFPNSYAGRSMVLRIQLLDNQTDVSGILSVDRIQVKK